MNIKLRSINFAASMSAFILGGIYIMSDGVSTTANVIGASGSGGGLTSIMGIILMLSAMGLFIVSMHGDGRNIDLERLIRKNNHFHQDLNSREEEEAPEIHGKI